METTQYFEELVRETAEQLETLERAAGLSDQVRRAQEGPVFPLGIDGAPHTSDEYFADQYDYLRMGIRDAYFSLSDVSKRVELIDKRLRLVELVTDSDRRRLENLRAELEQRKRQELPWTTAAIVSTIPVTLGYWLADVAGAMGGAVFGFFVGQGTIHNARNLAARGVRDAEDNLASAEEGARTVRRRPPFFSPGERRTGERDRSVDYKTATRSLKDDQRSGSA